MKGGILIDDDIGWVCRNLLTLRAGIWPDPEWSEPSPSRIAKFQARFVGPCELAADVEFRLSICGLDGFLLKQVYAWQETVEYLAQTLKMDERTIRKGIESCMEYITGWWPKDRSYAEKKGHKKAMPTRKNR